MSGIDFSNLTDDELLQNYGDFYNQYVIMQEDRCRSLPGITPNIANSFLFSVREDFLEEATEHFETLKRRLCLGQLHGDVIPIHMSSIMVNYEFICDYIKGQIIDLSVFAAIIKGLVDETETTHYNSYAFAMNNAEKLGLGFDKFEFLKCELGSFSEEVTVSQIVHVMNLINSNIKKLTKKYVAGIDKIGRVSIMKRIEFPVLDAEPELFLRISRHYNEHNNIVSYVQNEIGKFKLCAS